MLVEKRDGSFQEVDKSKIYRRIEYLCKGIAPTGDTIGVPLSLDPHEISDIIINSIIEGIKTTNLDLVASETCAYRVIDHPDYGTLASRIAISSHHKNTLNSFSETVEGLFNGGLIELKFYNIVMKFRTELDSAIMDVKDYEILDYFGFRTLLRSYFLKTGSIVERYQHLLMREAIGIHRDNLPEILKCYRDLSNALYTHATPTLLNSGKKNPQMSSCFLLGMHDSVDGMYEAIRRAVHISKNAGGIGFHLHNIRASGSIIRGTNGKSSGLVTLGRVLNNMAVHINQGGARPGAIALYLEPWHADIMQFLELRIPTGLESARARDLFYALWVPDLFMQRIVEALENPSRVVLWSLMCPDHSPGLHAVHSEEFNELYSKYEREGKYIRQVNILNIWNAILVSQKESGTPYMCYKDSVNRKSNQKNIGIIKSSNLCAEIVEYSDNTEYGTCNLASLNLTKMISYTGEQIPYFDFRLLFQVTKTIICNLNKVIDNNAYPVYQTAISNFRHRPVGLGVQGLADVFMILQMPFDSVEAREINDKIFEVMYFASLESSMELAQARTEQLKGVNTFKLKILSQEYEYKNEKVKEFELQEFNIDKVNPYEHGAYLKLKSEVSILKTEIDSLLEGSGLEYTYEFSYLNCRSPGAYSSFEGSPASEGILQHDMWGFKPTLRNHFSPAQWDVLKVRIMNHGLRNSLLLAMCPTATTSHLLGNVECIEPITSNLYSRQIIAGTFMIANKYLQRQLLKLGLWNESMKDKLIYYKGSVQQISEIPDDIKAIYKTVWEISKKTIIDMSADRGKWIDQSQSLNIYIENPSSEVLQTVHRYGWEQGLKTGMYYLRTRPIVSTQQFTLDSSIKRILAEKDDPLNKPIVCTRENKDCVSCSS